MIPDYSLMLAIFYRLYQNAVTFKKLCAKTIQQSLFVEFHALTLCRVGISAVEYAASHVRPNATSK